MFALRARRAGLRVIPLRNTQHTRSSLLVALKVHPKVAQRILRHSQIAMTMEGRAEASEQEVRAALGKLSQRWAAPAEHTATMTCSSGGPELGVSCTSFSYAVSTVRE
ncbi:hypothetical protein AQJ91_17780 [Streptomyces dysideae]|uniref:Tyr recombinase domain-containing protein n=1 Tax=Streptomyces dysideae TaxID=909626 RepID=A0A101UZC1_9ACTN|nr:hypothetical protein AQJ91_17780 [Streptomyces dysideae]